MNYVLECLDPLKYTIYSDLPGYTVGGDSMPPEICITTQKPDIVIIDEKQKIMKIYNYRCHLNKTLRRDTMKNLTSRLTSQQTVLGIAMM